MQQQMQKHQTLGNKPAPTQRDPSQIFSSKCAQHCDLFSVDTSSCIQEKMLGWLVRHLNLHHFLHPDQYQHNFVNIKI